MTDDSAGTDRTDEDRSSGSVGSDSLRRGVLVLLAGFVIPAYVGGLVVVGGPSNIAGNVAQGTGAETVVTTQGLLTLKTREADGWVSLYESNGTRRWGHSHPHPFYDATRLDNGTVLVAFAEQSDECGPYNPPCDRTGAWIIDPEPQPHVVWEYAWTTRKSGHAEVHDIEYLGDGRLVVADMEAEQLFSLNMSTRERGWTWNASSFYEAPDDPTTRDWLHINDVDQIAPGRYLVSVRNANQLLIVEPQHGTTDRDAVREVINRDRTDTNDRSCHSSGALVPDQNGDVRCGDPAVLHRQHNPQWLGNGTVLVADSENDRIVELHRAPNGTWLVGWATHRAGGAAYDWPRDADRRPDGTTLVTDSGNHRVVLVDENGTLRRAIRTDTMPYEAELPAGERVGGPAIGSLDGDPAVDRPGRQVYIATPVLRSVQHLVKLPWWFGELHLIGLFVSALLVTFGTTVVVGTLRSGDAKPNTERNGEGTESKGE